MNWKCFCIFGIDLIELSEHVIRFDTKCGMNLCSLDLGITPATKKKKKKES